MPDHPNGQPRKTSRPQPGDRQVPGPQGPRPVPQPVSPVPPSMEVLVEQFEELVAANQARFTELQQMGAAPDPLYLIHARINSLIDQIAAATGPNGPRWAVMTRLRFEQQIAAELTEAGPAVRQMQLAEGGRYTPAMIRALAAQTKTVRRTK